MSGRTPRPLVAGNWKMNGLRASQAVLAAVTDGYTDDLRAAVDLLVCPPATLVHAFAEAADGSGISVGGQDSHADTAGAYTGNVSPEMLADLGATFVILGHSERRSLHRETDADIRAKTVGAWRAGLTAVVCVGETREEREAGRAVAVVTDQMHGSIPAGATAGTLVVAYEPVWAIGTGLTPTAADVAAMHGSMRAVLKSIVGAEAAGIRLLYGGSVKPGNAHELLSVADVDGALVGGASLVASDFLGIARAYLG